MVHNDQTHNDTAARSRTHSMAAGCSLLDQTARLSLVGQKLTP